MAYNQTDFIFQDRLECYLEDYLSPRLVGPVEARIHAMSSYIVTMVAHRGLNNFKPMFSWLRAR